MIKMKKIRTVEDVESRRKKGNAYMVLVLNLKERDELEDLEVRERIILKCDFEEQIWRTWSEVISFKLWIGDWLLSARYINLGSHKILRIF